PAVLGAALGGQVRGDRQVLAPAIGDDAPARNARAAQDRRHGHGPALRQVLVVGGRAGVVGVADDLDPRVRVAVEVVGDGVEVVLDRALHRRAVGGEEDAFRHDHAELVALVDDADAAVADLGLQLARLAVEVGADDPAGEAADRGADHGAVELVLAALAGEDAGERADPGTRQRAFLGALV